jgi:hypothetical protein
MELEQPADDDGRHPKPSRTPTAQFGELTQAKPQARVRVTESEFLYLGMSVGQVLDASPHLPPPNSLPPPPPSVCPLQSARLG